MSEKVITKGKRGGWRPNSGRKAGFVGYWKGKKRPDAKFDHLFKYHTSGKENYLSTHIFYGENHPNWKGDKVGYDALHTWLYRELGQPDTCENCKKTGLKGKFIHWANKSGQYKRDLSDWLRLCAKCHYHYDRNKILL